MIIHHEYQYKNSWLNDKTNHWKECFYGDNVGVKLLEYNRTIDKKSTTIEKI